MTITINAPPGAKVLELGGGANRNPASTCNVDVRPGPGVDFPADFTGPLPIQSDEWDAVISFFCLEHLPYPALMGFLGEVLRVLKPGKMAVMTCPNTEAQLKWILEHPDGWDGHNLFESASCKLFGDQRHSEREGEANYGADSHKAYLSPSIVMDLFTQAGFVNVLVQPFGERATDLLIQATKPSGPAEAAPTPPPEQKPVEAGWELKDVPREELYTRHYFDGGTRYGGYSAPGYRDFPCHEITTRHILSRKPESVLELGCLVEDSLIVTNTGVVPIQNVDPGMEVYTHEGKFSKVSRVTFRPFDGEVICLEPRYSRGVPLHLTPDHPVYAVSVERKFKSWKPEIIGKPQWIPAGELTKESHWLVIPKPKREHLLEVHPDFARLGGYYLAEGWVQRKKNRGCRNERWGYVVSFCFHQNETDYMEDVRFLMKRFFGTTDGWVEKDDRKGVKLNFYSKEGYHRLLGLFGKGARSKSIPTEWVTGASVEALRALVVGMYRGDGSNPNNDKYSYRTASESLAISLRLVLMRLGIMPELARNSPRVGGVVRGKVIIGSGSWDVRATGSNYDLFADVMKENHRIRSDGRAYWFGREDDEFFYIPIKKLSREQYQGTVYNMDVEEDHSYSHPTCTVHNCGRGYVLKRLEDQGIRSLGLDVSQHCRLTRATERVHIWDVCKTPWDTLGDGRHDLCFSIGFWDHIPEDLLPTVIAEMERTCKRGLHGIDCGPPNFDRTRSTIRPIEWWRERLPKNHEVYQQHELEMGELPPEYVLGDGKVKLNIGSFTTMFHHGWENIDAHNLVDFANQNRYKFRQLDVRGGLPHGTATVDLIYSSHMLEHLDYAEGLRFLRDCRRVIKGGGAMRLIVPNTRLLVDYYYNEKDLILGLRTFDDLSNGCADSPTSAGKLWNLLAEGHRAFYDAETLHDLLKRAGFMPYIATFRDTDVEVRDGVRQILRECVDMLPDISLFVDAIPN